MIDWGRGGWTGSINKWVDREVREQLRANPMAQRSRYSKLHRILHFGLSIGTFGRFIAGYTIVNLLVLLVEWIIGWQRPNLLPTWGTSTEVAELSTLMLNVASYLITAQVGSLGVVTLAIALVTLIAQRENSSTDIQVYYHQSLAFEVVASCVALLAILCAQLLWPTQALLHSFGLGGDVPVFKLFLLVVHLIWLLLNLAAIAHFIATTFAFVQQSERERLRERYTAQVVFPRDMRRRLRERLYAMASVELLAASPKSDAPQATFGYDYGSSQATTEVQTIFGKPAALYDVRMFWVRWVLRRWAKRCTLTSNPQSSIAGLREQGPHLWFSPRIDMTLRGTNEWCRRRHGAPLSWLEKLVLRRAFRFRRVRDDE